MNHPCDGRTDRRTDGRTDGIAIAYARLAYNAVARKNDITYEECQFDSIMFALKLTGSESYSLSVYITLHVVITRLNRGIVLMSTVKTVKLLIKAGSSVEAGCHLMT